MVLATPPFWLATARTSVTGEVYAGPAGHRPGSEPGMPTIGPVEADPAHRPQERREKLKTPPSEATNR